MAFWNAHRTTNRNPRRPSSKFGKPLRLEWLEDRNGPSLFLGYPNVATTDLMPKAEDAPTAPVMYSSPTESSPESNPGNKPPKITNFSASHSNGMWTFSGTVVDETPGGLTVTFGGAIPAMVGRTVTTNANGSFSLTVNLNGDDGEVSAITTDPQGLTSPYAYTTVV
jgi:hypothetical protein